MQTLKLGINLDHPSLFCASVTYPWRDPRLKTKNRRRIESDIIYSWYWPHSNILWVKYSLNSTCTKYLTLEPNLIRSMNTFELHIHVAVEICFCRWIHLWWLICTTTNIWSIRQMLRPLPVYVVLEQRIYNQKTLHIIDLSVAHMIQCTGNVSHDFWNGNGKVEMINIK